MIKTWRKLGTFITIIIAGFLVFFFIYLENSSYTDFFCGCSSTCRTYHPTKTSRIIGDILMLLSILTFVISLWRIHKVPKWLIIPSAIIFTIAFYGNGSMLFNNGVCGNSLNQSTFFFNRHKLGDFAKSDSETINLGTLKHGEHKGKLLGFYLQGNNLTVIELQRNH